VPIGTQKPPSKSKTMKVSQLHISPGTSCN
jgi:hypothetical protein